MTDSKPRMVRLAEGFFGGLAKGVMVFVGVAVLIVAIFSGGADIAGDTLPTTKKGWGYFLLIILISIGGVITFLWLRRSFKL
jgi:Na+/melibiose symporter-like transporter